MKTIATRQKKTARAPTKLPLIQNERSSCDFTGYDADILMKETAKLRKLITKKGTLGPKLYFLRLPKSEKKTEDEYIAQINSDLRKRKSKRN